MQARLDGGRVGRRRDSGERDGAGRDGGGRVGGPAQASQAGQLIALAERLGRTAAVARALILSGRRVDLSGIEDGIGMLCAKTLDLPPGEARDVVAALHGLLAQLTSLTAALRPPGEG